MSTPRSDRRRVRPANARRGAWIWLWAAGVFLATQLVAGFVLDCVGSKITWPELEEMLARFRAEPRSPDVMIVGSSRLKWSISATELTHEVRGLTGESDFRAFNAALEANDYQAMEHTLGRLFAAGARPKLLLLEMTPQSMMVDSVTAKYNAARLWTWADLPEMAGTIVRGEALPEFAEARLVPLYMHRYHLLKNAREVLGVSPRPTPGVCDADAPRPTLPEEKFLADMQSTEAAIVPVDAKDIARFRRLFTVTGPKRQALERILADCGRRDVPVVLLGPPILSANRAFVEQAAKDDYERMLSELHAAFGVAFADAHAAMPDHFFMDHQHIKTPGEVHFGRYVARHVVAPRWRTVAPTGPVVPAQGVSFPR